MGFDALYDKAIIAPLAFLAGAVDALEKQIFVPLMSVGEGFIKRVGRFTETADDKGLNDGFNGACKGLLNRADSTSDSQSGRPQSYLRGIGLAMSLLLVLYFWLSA
jgi:hypothetical protein